MSAPAELAAAVVLAVQAHGGALFDALLESVALLEVCFEKWPQFSPDLKDGLTAFVGTDRERGGEQVEGMFMGIGRGTRQVVVEANCAALALFGFEFQSANGFEPGGVIIIILHERDVAGSGHTLRFGQAPVVFLLGGNVGVGEETGDVAKFLHLFHGVCGAGRATDVQEELFLLHGGD